MKISSIISSRIVLPIVTFVVGVVIGAAVNIVKPIDAHTADILRSGVKSAEYQDTVNPVIGSMLNGLVPGVYGLLSLPVSNAVVTTDVPGNLMSGLDSVVTPSLVSRMERRVGHPLVACGLVKELAVSVQRVS